MTNHRVVVIDDEPSIRALLADILTDGGYEPRSWPRGQHAHDFVKIIEPFAVLLDMNMETRDAGLHVAEAIRSDAKTSGIFIVIVSADHNLEIRYPRLRELSCRFHPKPIDIPILLSLLHEGRN